VAGERDLECASPRRGVPSNGRVHRAFATIADQRFVYSDKPTRLLVYIVQYIPLCTKPAIKDNMMGSERGSQKRKADLPHLLGGGGGDILRVQCHMFCVEIERVKVGPTLIMRANWERNKDMSTPIEQQNINFMKSCQRRPSQWSRTRPRRQGAVISAINRRSVEMSSRNYSLTRFSGKSDHYIKHQQQDHFTNGRHSRGLRG